MLYKRCDPKRGDILIGRIGTLGKAVIVDTDMEFSLFVSAALIRPNPAYIESAFLRFVLNSPGTKRQFDEIKVGGATHTNKLNLGDLKTLLIPAPPLAEQKRIVAKVDELMALCDRLEAQQQERETRHAALARASLARFADAPTPANLNLIFHSSYSIPPADLRKSILTLAVEGKLVPQEPNDEPAEVPALSRVTKSKGERQAPFELPGNWKWMQLGQVSELINGDRSKNYPNKAEYVPEGVAWINTGHIEPDGTLSTEWMHFITRKKFDSLRSGKVRPGDLVYCLRGATLGKSAIITQYEEGAVASSLVIIRLIPAVEPRFAYRFLTSPLGREQIFQFDNGSAQPNLSANSVKKYWVPIPPLAEQRRIVAKVEQLMALVDALEQQIAASRATAANLLAALVAELTGTDHNGRVSVPATSTTGRRGRPRKSA
jgi:type I restriction enzyme S subunit